VHLTDLNAIKGVINLKTLPPVHWLNLITRIIAELREPLGCEACPLVLEDLTASNFIITVEPED
jgi:hypothetical protein